jgi:putative aldouronate transport system permease protein
LSSAFEKVYLMQNPLNQRSSEVIDTYTLRVSIFSQTPQWSYAAAIGLFKAVVGLILILAANQIARRLKATSLW